MSHMSITYPTCTWCKEYGWQTNGCQALEPKIMIIIVQKIMMIIIMIIIMIMIVIMLIIMINMMLS